MFLHYYHNCFQDVVNGEKFLKNFLIFNLTLNKNFSVTKEEGNHEGKPNEAVEKKENYPLASNIFNFRPRHCGAKIHQQYTYPQKFTLPTPLSKTQLNPFFCPINSASNSGFQFYRSTYQHSNEVASTSNSEIDHCDENKNKPSTGLEQESKEVLNVNRHGASGNGHKSAKNNGR